MTEASPNRSTRGRWLLGLAASALLAFGLFLALTGIRIAREGTKQELHHADAIIVFGAAEYAGHPSPVLRARLEHAYDLFEQGLAPVVITTGGAASDPSFSEGGVGLEYLKHRGIPERSLIAETQGSDTAHSAIRVAVIMRANGLHSCIAVSDAYHVFRIKKILRHEGLGPVYVSPRPDSRPRGVLQRMYAVLREASSYLLWKMGMS
ncbi:MAG TPA: YdcF family protein [Candidatus Binatia bacterium]|nr:YdcF family protein [Candidatus Binatia bacterium]